MATFSAKLHTLWETHELHMEIAVLAIATTLLSLMVLLPTLSEAPKDTEVPGNTETSFLDTDTPKEGAARGDLSPGFFVTSPDASLERAALEQNLTKTTREISEIQKSSLAITALIQKECGGQTNDCAKKLQASLEENAREYDRAQERLRALTASLGNLD